MEKGCKRVRIHLDFLDFLFAHKRQCMRVFNDIKGIHEIDHLAITYVTSGHQLLTLSSSPAIEYQLFSSKLWEYDLSYNAAWFRRLTHASWEELYNPVRFDELYYIKQVKSALATGASFSAQFREHSVIYSFASKKSCPHTLDLFTNHQEDFTKIGHFCLQQLLEFFIEKEEVTLPQPKKVLL